MTSQSAAIRERVALIHRGESSGLDPKDITLQDGHLTLPSFEAVREDRLTIPIDELPANIQAHIDAFSALSVRWSSPQTYDTLDPLGLRVPPGLHVTYEPSENTRGEAEHACHILNAFGISPCSAEVFQSSVARPGKAKPSPQFYQALEDLDALSDALKKLCPSDDDACFSRAELLKTASALELAYEQGSPAKLFVIWPLGQHQLSLSPHSSRKTEVGIFESGSHFKTAPHSLGLMGELLVLNDGGRRSAVSFQIQSRHRMSKEHFSSAFLTPTGLHPSLQLRFSSNQPPRPAAKHGDCVMYAYLSLPKTVFPDRYQLDDALFMASKNLTSLVQQWGLVDLEAPVYRTSAWGSHVLVQLASPPVDDDDVDDSGDGDSQEWTAEIPLHLRYLEPNEKATREVDVPYPSVFWACEAGSDVNFQDNPFNRMRVGYEEQFSSSTSFWHLTPRPAAGLGRLANTVTVPVLKAGGAEWVEAGTSAAIATGCGWIAWKLASSLLRSWRGTPSEPKKHKQ